MPQYEYRCTKCQQLVTHLFTLAEKAEYDEKPDFCPKCVGPMKRCFVNPQALRLFKPDYYDHITTKPLYIESRKQLKEQCEKHGVRSGYIENSFNR